MQVNNESFKGERTVVCLNTATKPLICQRNSSHFRKKMGESYTLTKSLVSGYFHADERERMHIFTITFEVA